jgi:hypothetical protein
VLELFGGVNWVRICNKKILQCWNFWWSELVRICNKKILQCWIFWWSELGEDL